ncbi:MAG: peptide deformylase [gamma proteobacterium symbiont of Taylorina sp.]|nr:peptide deformylase [gamma proteobacterium symbiont of Taylorina sp.]
MPLLDILCFPDDRLRTRAKKVNSLTLEHQKFIDDMLATMYEAPGIGLAATQVNRHERIIVIDVSENKADPYCFINPEIISSSGQETMEEGCLSVPETYAEIERADSVVVRYMDRKGKEQTLETSGLLAVCIQHEIDHLQGKLFVDYLSKLKRDRIRKKLEKQWRQKL